MSLIKVPLNQKVKQIHSFREVSSLPDMLSDSDSFSGDMGSMELSNGVKRLTNHLRNQVKVLEAALQKAREDSYKAGYDEARFVIEKRFREEISGLKETYESTIESLRNEYDESLSSLSQPLARFATGIAEKVIGRTLSEEEKQNEFLLTQLQRFLKEATVETKFKIKVNPRQLSWISDVDNQKQSLPNSDQLSFIPDEDLKPGECIVETDTEIIQGLIPEYLNFIGQNLFHGESC